MEVVKGIPVAPGVVIGRAFIFEDVRIRVPMHSIPAGDVPRELARLEQVLAEVRADLERDRDHAAEKLGEEPAKIFAFHLGLLGDPSLIGPIREMIEHQRVSVAYAVSEAFRQLADRFRSLEGQVFKEKAGDVLDLDKRILARLFGADGDRLARVTSPGGVGAPQLPPPRGAPPATLQIRRAGCPVCLAAR